MRKYLTDQMISKSRFTVLYQNSDIEIQESVKQYIQKLIAENKKYTDKGNYSYLCNLFTAMAFCFTYEDRGITRAESLDRVRKAMYLFIEPKIQQMKKLSSMPFFISTLRILMPIKFRKLGYGWKITFPKVDKNTFSMITYECIICQICNKYKISELASAFCYVDDLLYGNLPNVRFLYTEQKGCGGRFCDYSFTRKCRETPKN